MQETRKMLPWYMYVVLLRSCGLLQRMGKDYDNVKGMLVHSILTFFLLYWLFYSVNNINVIAFAETPDSVFLSWGKFCQSEVSLMIILFSESHNSSDSYSFLQENCFMLCWGWRKGLHGVGILFLWLCLCEHFKVWACVDPIA